MAKTFDHSRSSLPFVNLKDKVRATVTETRFGSSVDLVFVKVSKKPPLFWLGGVVSLGELRSDTDGVHTPILALLEVVSIDEVSLCLRPVTRTQFPEWVVVPKLILLRFQGAGSFGL